METKINVLHVLFLLTFAPAYTAYGHNVSTVKITADFKYVYPGHGRVFHIEDKQGSMTPEDFYRLYQQGKVDVGDSKMPYFDKSDSFWWLGMQVENVTSELRRVVVEVDFVYMDRLDFYVWEEGKLIKSVRNFSWRTASRLRPIPHRVFAIDFPVAPDSAYVWALRIQKKDGYLAVPLRMFDYHEFVHLSKINYNAHGIAVGIMLLGIVMGLALYLLSRDVMYAFYSGYIFSVSGMVVSEQGYLINTSRNYTTSCRHTIPGFIFSR
nr:7TM-DISM domain-containing protein [Dyadobacter fermentans]